MNRIIFLIFAGYIAGCSSLALQPKQMVMGMDRTMNVSHVNQERPLILVTITDEAHQRLVQGQGINREGGLPPLYAAFLAKLSRSYGLERVADWPLQSLEIHCLVFEATTIATQDVLNKLGGEQYVETAQVLNYFSVTADKETIKTAYDDPYYKMQPGHQTLQVGESHGWATGKGVRIAIIDTGLDTDHVDLNRQLAGFKNFVDRSNTGFKADVHGTAVAGVIAASANNGVGMVGVAPDAQLYALKACAQGTVGSGARCTSFTLAKAMNFAIGEQVDIINLSLTGPEDPLLARLVAKALEQGMLVVGAAGKGPEDRFPGEVEGVITVDSLTNNAKSGDKSHTILAPGNKILTTAPNDAYDFFSGSSFATAHVAGVAALIRQRKPHLSSAVIEQLLAGTADEASGYANACQALARVVTGGSCPTNSGVAAKSTR